MTKSVWSHVLASRPQAGTAHDAICEISTDGATVPDCEVLNYEESSYNHLPGSPTTPDCIIYIIGVFCYNLKSQTNILAS